MKNLVFICSLFILVSAFDENTLSEAKKKVLDGVQQLAAGEKAGDVEGALSNIASEVQLPPGVTFPSIAEGEDALRERCLKYGTNESFDRAMEAKEEVQFCVKGFVNFTQIEKEVSKSRLTGDLDTVFRKYCRNSTVIRNCVTNFTDAMEPCLRPEEREMKITITNITDALINFICFKEGDRIALFIAEGGPECLKNNTESIQQCINSTFSHYVPKDFEENNLDTMVPFKLEAEQCQDVTKLQKCIVGHLEKCPEPTPANIVDSMFTYVRKTTPCQKYEPSSASWSLVNHFTLVVSVVATLAAYYH